MPSFASTRWQSPAAIFATDVAVTAGLQRGDPGVGPAGDELGVPLAARVAVTEQPLRAGLRAGAQPVAHIAGQPDPPVVPGRQRQRRQRHPQPADHDVPAVQRAVQAAVPPGVALADVSLSDGTSGWAVGERSAADRQSGIALRWSGGPWSESR